MSSIIFNSLLRFCRAWAVAHQPRVWSNVAVKSASGRDVGVVLDGNKQSVYWDSSIIPRVGSSCFVVQDSQGHLVGFNGSQDLQLSVDIEKSGTVPRLQNAGGGKGISMLPSLSLYGSIIIVIKGIPHTFKDPRYHSSKFEAILVDLAGNKYSVPVYLPLGYSIVSDLEFEAMINKIRVFAAAPCPGVPV